MVLLSNYDRVVCLCVDKRFNQERERIQNLIREADVDPTRFHFLLEGDGTMFRPNLYWQISPTPPESWRHSKGAYAHFCAFKRAIVEAMESGARNLLWLEDDVVLADDAFSIIAKATDQLRELQSPSSTADQAGFARRARSASTPKGENVPVWDLLYYGANHTWATTYDLSENVIRCYGSLTTHCLGIPSHMFERLLKIPPVHVIDKVIADSVHHTHYCLAVWPSVAVQKPGYSHLSNMEADYTEYFKCKGANRL